MQNPPDQHELPVVSVSERAEATIRPAKPQIEAKYCFTCRCWWVPFNTRVYRAGWALCRMCHDCQWTDDFDEIPWENRRIRLIGLPGDPKHSRLHGIVKNASTSEKTSDHTKEPDGCPNKKSNTCSESSTE